jgi:hypothetical protein
MKTITFEIDNENDFYLLLALAKRLKLKSIVTETNELINHLNTPEGGPLPAKELLERLENAEKEESISFEKFKENLMKW